MRNFLGLISPVAILALGTLAGSANAAVIGYTTSGVFQCNGLAGCAAAGNVATVGGLTVTYNGQPSTSVTAAPTAAANYGNITVSGATNTALTALNNLLLVMTVNQTNPYAQNNGSFTGIVTGSVGLTAGSSTGFASICFIANACANQVESIVYSSGAPSITYRLQTPANPAAPPANGYAIRATAIGGTPDSTTFQGSVTDNTVPEPTTYLMLVSGLFGMGLIGRRKVSN